MQDTLYVANIFGGIHPTKQIKESGPRQGNGVVAFQHWRPILFLPLPAEPSREVFVQMGQLSDLPKVTEQICAALRHRAVHSSPSVDRETFHATPC